MKLSTSPSVFYGAELLAALKRSSASVIALIDTSDRARASRFSRTSRRPRIASMQVSVSSKNLT